MHCRLAADLLDCHYDHHNYKPQELSISQSHMECTKKFMCPKLKMPSFGHVRQEMLLQILMPKSGSHFHTSLHCWQIYVKLCVCRLWGREVASFCNGKAPQRLPVITILDNCDFNLWSFLITTSLKSQFLRWQQFVTICEYSLPVIIMPMRRTLRYCTLWYSFKSSWSDSCRFHDQYCNTCWKCWWWGFTLKLVKVIWNLCMTARMMVADGNSKVVQSLASQTSATCSCSKKGTNLKM